MLCLDFLLATMLAIGVASGAWDNTAGSQDKAKVGEYVQVNLAGHGDVPALYQVSDAVARVRIEERKVLPGRHRASVVTEYHCRVITLLKGDPALSGGVLVVRRPGGTRDDGDVLFETVVAQYPDFQVGEEYVLFARRDASTGTLSVQPEGTFGISQDLIVPFGGSAEMVRHRRKPAGDFIAEIQALRKK